MFKKKIKVGPFTLKQQTWGKKRPSPDKIERTAISR